MTLFEITGMFLNLYNIDTDETGMDEDAVLDTLESLEMELNLKAENVAIVYKQLMADVESIKAEQKKMMDRRKAAETRAENLKNYLQNMLTAAGKDKIEGTRAKVTITKGREKVVITDIDSLKDVGNIWKPYNWVEDNVSKTTLKEMLDAGEVVEGAKLVREAGILIK